MKIKDDKVVFYIKKKTDNNKDNNKKINKEPCYKKNVMPIWRGLKNALALFTLKNCYSFVNDKKAKYKSSIVFWL